MANTHVPNGVAADMKAECEAYDAFIKSVGGIDLQLLGIGNNGHIGFNEPSSCFELGTHIVDLTENTIQANSRLFEKEEDVPRQAVTMGIRNILQADKIVLIATGEAKAEAVKKTVLGPVTPEVPASILLLHKNVSIVADDAALSLIPEEYYK